MKITTNTCEALRKELEEEIFPMLLKKYNIRFSAGPMRYSTRNMSVTINGEAIDDGVDVEDEDAVRRSMFERNAPLFGGDPDWFGREITINKNRYIIADIDPKAKKNAFLIRHTGNGKLYKCDTDTIKKQISKTA